MSKLLYHMSSLGSHLRDRNLHSVQQTSISTHLEEEVHENYSWAYRYPFAHEIFPAVAAVPAAERVLHYHPVEDHQAAVDVLLPTPAVVVDSAPTVVEDQVVLLILMMIVASADLGVAYY